MRKFTQKTKQRIADRKAAILNRFNEHVASEDAKFEMILDAKARAELATRTRKKAQ